MKILLICLISAMTLSGCIEFEPDRVAMEEETTLPTQNELTFEAETETATEETTVEEEIILSEDEYKAQCKEMFYDEIFFGEEDLEGKNVKLHLFVSEACYFTVDDLYSAILGEYIEKYSVKRDFFKCCVLREDEESYVGQQISMWFSDDFGLEPGDCEPGDKIVVYADVIIWSNNTWDGYNSVTIIPRYIESE